MKNVPLSKIAHLLGVDSEDVAQVTGYQIDSRLVAPGNLFFALRGEATDGHCHLGQVFERGGVGAVVSSQYEGPDFGLKLLRVDDVLASLQLLARLFIEEARREKGLQIVGITGSVGKTMTKEFTATLLEGKYRVGKSEKSWNTKRTYPITLLNREEGQEVLVVELGMSEPGDIGRLLEIAAPDISVLTKVALAHSAFFPGGLEEIARYKAEVFSSARTHTAIYFQGLHQFPEAMEKIHAEKITFSIDDPSADYFLSPCEKKYCLDERGVRAYQFDLPFNQPHLLHNFLGAVCVARALKMSCDEIQRQVPFLRVPKMRFEQFQRGGICFINDVYNANPESMRAALSNLPEPNAEGKRIAVLGSMLDLGLYSESSHQEIGRFAQKHVDHLLVFGQEAAPLAEAFGEVKKPVEHFLEVGRLTERLRELMRQGDVVLVKGSRGMKMEKVFDLLDFDLPAEEKNLTLQR